MKLIGSILNITIVVSFRKPGDFLAYIFGIPGFSKLYIFSKGLKPAMKAIKTTQSKRYHLYRNDIFQHLLLRPWLHRYTLTCLFFYYVKCQATTKPRSTTLITYCGSQMNVSHYANTLDLQRNSHFLGE